jgi:CheY-like chemotaxis protein
MASAFPPKRILVVDDNRDAADITAALLEMHGHIAFAVYGGKDCIQRAAALVPDIILLDLSMPVIDGFEVAASLSQYPQLRSVVLVALTARSDAETRARTAAAGFREHLVKPIQIEKIVQAVNSCIA